MGRPCLPDDKRKDYYILKIRLSKEEKDILDALRRKVNISYSDIVRKAITLLFEEINNDNN